MKMTGVTCSDMEELRNRGYQIREDSKTQIWKENEVVVEITIDENALLTIVVEKEELKDLKWIEIKTLELPKIILLEMEDEKGKQHFCELPTKKGQPIFW